MEEQQELSESREEWDGQRRNSERKEGTKGAQLMLKRSACSWVPLLVVEVWGSQERRMAKFVCVKFKLPATNPRKSLEMWLWMKG